MKMNKKSYPQVYVEECKYKVKKINTPIFINIELESDSEPDSEPDRFRVKHSNRKLMIELKY